MRSRSDYKKIYSAYNGAGRDVYVPVMYHKTFEKILKEYRSNYHMTSILRQIISLNANPLQGKRRNPAGDICDVQSGNIYMQYSLYNGAALIDYLSIGIPVPDDHFGLYSVEFNKRGNRWAPTEQPVDAIENDHQWKSKTGKAHYVAVAGRFDNKADAGNLLAAHVIGAYQKADYLSSSDAQGPFSMFWIKKGQHKSPEAAQALASIMQQTSQSNRSVNWLVHDAGTDTFKAAAKILAHLHESGGQFSHCNMARKGVAWTHGKAPKNRVCRCALSRDLTWRSARGHL